LQHQVVEVVLVVLVNHFKRLLDQELKFLVEVVMDFLTVFLERQPSMQQAVVVQED